MSGRCVWLTGLCGSGKTTLARKLKRLWEGPTVLLDGDDLRRTLSPDLGFSYVDRLENVRRAAMLAASYLDDDLWVVAALVTPYAEARAIARDLIGQERFTLVHVDTPLEVCEARKPELYGRARAGAIPMFTGVSDIFQPVDDAAFVVDGQDTDEAAVAIEMLLCRNLMGRRG